ncbi:hypothetical protein YC2023_072297 [Brassica napus]
MAKSNRNARRTVNETGEGSASNVARNEAGTEEARNAAQNAANLNNAAAAGDAAGAVGLEAVLAIMAQVLARLPAVAAPPVVPPVVDEAEQVVQDGEDAHKRESVRKSKCLAQWRMSILVSMRGRIKRW